MSRLRTKLKQDRLPVYDKVLLQEKHWWGWKTVGWRFTHSFDEILAANKRELTRLSKRLGVEL